MHTPRQCHDATGRRFSTPHTLRMLLISGVLTLAVLFGHGSAMAQGAYYLPTQLTANTSTSSNSFIAFDITAHQAVRLYRFWNSFAGTGTTIVDIWAHPNGYVNQNTGWIHLGRANVTVTNTTSHVEIPINLDFLIQANETWGFIISHHTISVRYNSTVTPATYTDSRITISAGAHCAGTGTGDPTTGVTSFSFSLCPRQWAGAVYYDEGATAPNDAGIGSIDSPKDFCAGVHDVTATLQNFGINQITSATINWKLNGVPQTPYSWTGLLDTLTSASRKTSVTLATMNFASGVPYTFEMWSSNPNGVADTVNFNDTVRVTRKSALSGTMTIGGTNPTYQTFDEALTDLHDNGLCGPVVFNVRPGTYNEQVALGSAGRGTISGVSATNTITFQSETGNRGDVTVTFSSLTGNPTLYINATNYVTFRNMTFRATNNTYCIVLYILGGSEHCTFENLDLIGEPTTTISTNTAIVYSPSGSLDNYTTFRNCNIVNGSYGMYLYGGGTTSTENFNVIEGCRWTGQYYYPLMSYYCGELTFTDNTIIQNSAYATKYLGMFYYGFNTSIERNTFLSDGGTAYGIYLYYDNYYQAGSSRFVNNFVATINATTGYYAFRPYYCNDLLVAHNTILNTSTYASGYAAYSYYGSNQRYLNNIMLNTGGGRAWYVPSPAAIIESDYNDLYASGPVLAYWSGDRANLLALQTASGMDAASVSKSVSFADYSTGDLHLAAPSDDDDDLIGTLLSQVGDDIDKDPRVRPYMGADEACYLIPNSLQYEFVDGGGNPIAYATIPGTVGVHYTVIFPPFDATIQMTANFYTVPGNQLMYTQSFSAAKLAGQTLDGTAYFTIPSNMPVGFYRIELVFNTKNSCGYYRDYMPYPTSLMLIGQGSTPCEVWPGDVNNDGLVNYTDRKDLNLYIYDANLNTLWLNGPARYRADAAQNPLTYLMWQPQASVPWYTTMGCYMDADGNGVVNNFDYIAIKLNWMRSHGAIAPKQDNQFQPTTFDMTQNYPNPFNPTTQIEYSVPERTQVQLRIVDMLGREIAMPVNGIVETGVYQVEFDGSSLPSGQYLAIVSMTGQETGLGFNKTVKMVLNK
ncbi:MAG: T9SS type A sorting domain-containing protein [Bacteroidetes bacterium]|nr:T9SS type A sorting domain-containing protein [Bacteroidota bacterium]